MKKDHLTYLPEKGDIRPVILQHLVEIYHHIYYFFAHILGIFIELPHHTEGDKRPVVCVSGFLGRGLTWYDMRKHLISLGHPVYVVPLGFQTGNIRKKSKILENFLIENDIKDCYLLCHSMGGLIAAGLSYKGRDRVRKIFTIGSPIHGTYMAYLAPIFPCTWQMMPGSKLVKEVVDTYSKFHNVQAVFTKGEGIVRPWESARLGNFDDVEIPEYGHLNLYLGALGIECMGSLLTSEEKKDPLPVKPKASPKAEAPSKTIASGAKPSVKKTSGKKAPAPKKKAAPKKAKPKKKR
ncbi:alpha/beta hydrolase [Leptospira wolffii]|uniref:esterase/lipase family protein n=1 Tax=Leptospira wolffii TaxID=409998 RepID=UPI00034BE13D|nr:alpha/beta hydrolase [Leptospira wolffii]TGK58243.1 alpha/beta hydrolase [Leptospira wolffii]TGK66381.1 alpha/beta hydrolase [Leptospira wolffii]TGK68921.1 alpha/beta hydrolase [Leptospira wolffii]TGL27273.1 alpha/beta hydrolase [Leptospira wolffii]